MSAASTGLRRGHLTILRRHSAPDGAAPSGAKEPASAGPRPRPLLVAHAVALLFAGCSPAPQLADGDRQSRAAEIGTEPVSSIEPSDEGRRVIPTSPTPGVEPSLEQFFSGKALALIQQSSQPAPPTVISDVASHVEGLGALEACSLQSAPLATRLIDLDDDGTVEAISFYDLSGCRDDAVIRVLGVFRQAGDGTWKSVMDTAVSVRPGEERPLLALGGGSITVAGGSDGFGGLADPEVVPVPSAAGVVDQGVVPAEVPTP